MTGAGFPAFDPVVIRDVEGPTVSIEIRCHYFVPAYAVLSVVGSDAATAALDDATARDLADALSDWIAARRRLTRGGTP